MTSEETLCLYCQREYASPNRLRLHVERLHKGTYRAIAYAKEKEHTKERA